jgi:hypothetical protein
MSDEPNTVTLEVSGLETGARVFIQGGGDGTYSEEYTVQYVTDTSITLRVWKYRSLGERLLRTAAGAEDDDVGIKPLKTFS